MVFEDLKYDDSGTLSSLKYKLRLNPEDVWEQTQYMFFPVQMPGPRVGFAGTGGMFDVYFICIKCISNGSSTRNMGLASAVEKWP